MNHEIFELPLGLHGMSTHMLKRRCVILARFLKRFVGDLDREPDDLYMAGLLYNFPYVSYEHLLNRSVFSDEPFEEVKSECVQATAATLAEIGFEPYVVAMLEDSISDLYDTRNPFEHALLRNANDVLESAERTNATLGRVNDQSKSLDATGYSNAKSLIYSRNFPKLQRHYRSLNALSSTRFLSDSSSSA